MNKWIIISIVVVVLAAVGYWVYNEQKKKKEDATKTDPANFGPVAADGTNMY